MVILPFKLRKTFYTELESIKWANRANNRLVLALSLGNHLVTWPEREEFLRKPVVFFVCRITVAS